MVTPRRPNECWQADVNHRVLASGIEVEILNLIDDYSRLCVAADVRSVTDIHGVLESFKAAAATWGLSGLGAHRQCGHLQRPGGQGTRHQGSAVTATQITRYWVADQPLLI